MSYACYLGGVELPTPGKLTLKIKNQNKTLTLLNEGEVNLLRTPGLTELTVPLVLPMLGGGPAPEDYLGLLEALKAEKRTTQFILVRLSPDGRSLFDTNLTVSVEDYAVTEDAAKGLDVSVDVQLKQWRDYGVATATVESAGKGRPATVKIERERKADTAPAARTYTVQKGDSLWAIAARYYGKGAAYAKIADANTDQISNPNEIYPGQVITLP